MATTKKAVPGLTFRVTVEPLMRGEVMENVRADVFEWNQTFACEWHEKHPDTCIQTALKDMRERVKRAITPVSTRRKK